MPRLPHLSTERLPREAFDRLSNNDRIEELIASVPAERVFSIWLQKMVKIVWNVQAKAELTDAWGDYDQDEGFQTGNWYCLQISAKNVGKVALKAVRVRLANTSPRVEFYADEAFTRRATPSDLESPATRVLDPNELTPPLRTYFRTLGSGDEEAQLGEMSVSGEIVPRGQITQTLDALFD